MQRRKNSSFIQKIFDYLFVFFTILQCNTVYYSHSESNKKIIDAIWFVLFAILIFISIYKLLTEKFDVFPLLKFLVAFSSMLILFLYIEYVRYPFGIFSTLVYVVIPLGMVIVFYCRIKDGKWLDLLLEFKNVVLILSVISLFFWLLSLFGFPTNGSYFINWGIERIIPDYFNIHFIAQESVSFFGMNTVRNTGIFDEAPMYSYVLSVTLLIKLFLDKNHFDIQSLILIITILTTTSTTGILVALSATFYYVFFISALKKYRGVSMLLLVVVIPVFIGVFVVVLKGKIDNNWNSSSSIRMDDIIAGFMSWKDHFILGNGIGNDSSIMNYMDYRRLLLNGNSGFSSGLMRVLSYGGIAFLLYYLIPTLLMIKVSAKLSGFSILLFLLFIVTVINGTYLYIMMISFFWALYISKEKNYMYD